MKIINIVDSLAKVNFGIWNSAVSTAHILKQEYGVESELWYPKPENPVTDVTMYNGCTLREIGTFSFSDVITADTIIVSHGCWQLPTRLAYKLKKQFGIRWMYVPHGMLEPNSMKQKRVFKQLFYIFIERPFSRKADVVRAVSLPEQLRLQKTYSKVIHIANGVTEQNIQSTIKNLNQYLFMARIHRQKGVVELARGWKKSDLSKTGKHQLLIVGPDDGELANLQKEINGEASIQYLGAKYGAEKQQLLMESQFYVLPSRAEGFPTSVVEAMQYGLIPLITEFCNFPEVVEKGLAFKTSIDDDEIATSLNATLMLDTKKITDLSENAVAFIDQHFLLNKIAQQQFELFKSLN